VALEETPETIETTPALFPGLKKTVNMKKQGAIPERDPRRSKKWNQ